MLGDLVVEPRETFSLNLTLPVGATLARGKGTATILDNDVVPAVTTLTPASGKRGAVVTIRGMGFGASRGTSVVKFGTKACTKYVFWSSTRIKCKVPAKAKFGKIKVVVTTPIGAGNSKKL